MNSGLDMIRNDLRNMAPKEFYFKHILKSQNWYFKNYLQIPTDELIDKMDYFKEIVSNNLQINFHSIQIVGSAKIGYSLSPQKILHPFHSETGNQTSSDIDIAIVSEELFLFFWKKLRNTKKLYNEQIYRKIAKSIFRGYINEKDMIKMDDIRNYWSDLASPANKALQDKLGFVHPISYRIYRNWDDLEEYQLIGIKKAKNTLEE